MLKESSATYKRRTADKFKVKLIFRQQFLLHPKTTKTAHYVDPTKATQPTKTRFCQEMRNHTVTSNVALIGIITRNTYMQK